MLIDSSSLVMGQVRLLKGRGLDEASVKALHFKAKDGQESVNRAR